MQGSGPFGMPMPGEVQQLVARVQESASATWPKLNKLMQEPGASEVMSSVSNQLAQRFTARMIKLVFGSQQAMQQAK